VKIDVPVATGTVRGSIDRKPGEMLERFNTSEDVLNSDPARVKRRCVIPIAGGWNPAKMSRTRPDQVEGRKRIEQSMRKNHGGSATETLD
jgi:hypothetical protein